MTISPDELAKRLRAKDVTLWSSGNVAANRLGWLDVPREMSREARQLRKWAESIDQDTVVVLGSGGSSLGPAVLGSLAASFGRPIGRRIVVCDTTDPETVSEAPIEDGFVLISSKSGTSLESNAFFDYARSRLKDLKRYAVISDPRTPLVSQAEEIGVNRIFANRADIGGRYSVLSYFGLVPAVLGGYDVEELCGRALDIDPVEACELGALIGEAVQEGRDKTTILTDLATRDLGLWIAQLLAASTGKEGIGVIPVPTTDPEDGEDRHHIEVSLGEAHELGAAFYRFEIASAIAAHVLDVDPFDQPNVAESKANTADLLENLPLPRDEALGPEALDHFLAEELRTGDYISLQAYLPYRTASVLAAVRQKVRDKHDGIAVTAEFGPRFLHGSGQLHKGGPNSVVAVQIVGRSPGPEIPIPAKRYDFGTLINAQSIGDYQSLQNHGRRVIRIAVNELAELL